MSVEADAYDENRPASLLNPMISFKRGNKSFQMRNHWVTVTKT